jgi:hypothetical protein
MTATARRSGLETLRAVLRRRNPGFDAVFEVERHDRVDDTATGKVGRSLAAPQDPGAAVDRIDVTAATARTLHEHDVDEAAENLRRSSRGRAR